MTKAAKKHTAEFKAKVALAAIRGDRTIPELSAEFGVYPSVIHKWKRKALDSLSSVFANGSKSPEGASEAVIAGLYEKIGKLTVERDFLAKRSGA